MSAESTEWMLESFYLWKMSNTGDDLSALEFGVSDGVREVIAPHVSSYVSVSLQGGGESVVIDNPETYQTSHRFDVVVCCDLFDGSDNWPDIIGNAYRLLNVGGLFVATMLGTSGFSSDQCDGVLHGLYNAYHGIYEDDLEAVLRMFASYYTDSSGNSLRCWAVK